MSSIRRNGKYTYKVKSINPQKRSDFIVLTWHQVKERFLTPSQLKKRLSESFPERVPPHMDFHVGYFEGKANAKCWIVSEEDIQAMYDAHFEGDVITVWCDGRGKTEDTSVSRKRKKDADDTDTPLSKREERECQQQKIYDELKKKHSDKKYTDPQLKLWAKLIQSRMHDSYDNPPKYPSYYWCKHKKDSKSIYPHWSSCDSCQCNCFCIKATRKHSHNCSKTPPLSQKNKFQVQQSLHAHVPAYVEPFMKI